MKHTRKSRPDQRKKGYIDNRIEAGDTESIKKLREYFWGHDIHYGTNYRLILNDLFTDEAKPTYSKIMHTHGYSDIKDFKELIERFHVLAEKLDKSEGA